jgi:enamine deaminase RidA (YjgF/YER057c/UK114 family)
MKARGVMTQKPINSAAAPHPLGGYAQAIEVSSTTRRLYISGQIPVTPEGSVPSSFQDQAKLVWANIEAQLCEANMGMQNLAKVTIFLSDRKYGLENRQIRKDVLCGHAIASTVIIAGIFDDEWLLEIEAIAEA